MDLYKILDVLKTIEENNQFAGQAHGQQAGDQWKGTDAGTPGTKLVGECDAPMTLTDKLRARWEETKKQKGLQEYGAIGATGAVGAGGPANATTNVNDPAAQAKQVAKTQQAMNKLKSAGVNIPNVNQAVKSTLKDPTQEPVTAQDKQVAAGLGQEIEQLVSTGDASAINQLSSLIQKSKQQGGA